MGSLNPQPEQAVTKSPFPFLLSVRGVVESWVFTTFQGWWGALPPCGVTGGKLGEQQWGTSAPSSQGSICRGLRGLELPPLPKGNQRSFHLECQWWPRGKPGLLLPSNKAVHPYPLLAWCHRKPAKAGASKDTQNVKDATEKSLAVQRTRMILTWMKKDNQ